MKLVSRKSSSSPWSSGRNGGRCADYNTPLIIGRYWTLFYSVTSVFSFLLLGLITLQPRLPQPATRTKCTAHAHQTSYLLPGPECAHALILHHPYICFHSCSYTSQYILSPKFSILVDNTDTQLLLAIIVRCSSDIAIID